MALWLGMAKPRPITGSKQANPKHALDQLMLPQLIEPGLSVEGHTALA
jgi:hypothetical protein